MPITNHQYSLLLHDLKRIGKAIQIICDEENKEKRKIVAELIRAECDRLVEDIEEVREKNQENLKKRKK
jgi:hypothetical protein